MRPSRRSSRVRANRRVRVCSPVPHRCRWWSRRARPARRVSRLRQYLRAPGLPPAQSRVRHLHPACSHSPAPPYRCPPATTASAHHRVASGCRALRRAVPARALARCSSPAKARCAPAPSPSVAARECRVPAAGRAVPAPSPPPVFRAAAGCAAVACAGPRSPRPVAAPALRAPATAVAACRAVSAAATGRPAAPVRALR